MIEPATGCFEIIRYKDKHADIISNLVEQTWLCRYPRPTTIILYDQRKEMLGHKLTNSLIKNKYGIKYKCENMANHQANYILERIHQVIVNLVHTFNLNKYLPRLG